MGYDIADYRAIHPPYGKLEDVEKLIAELHRRDMKLVMDLVVNHTSDQVRVVRAKLAAPPRPSIVADQPSQHAWFKESRSQASSKRDWYIWRKPVIDDQGKRHPPNNWASIFGGELPLLPLSPPFAREDVQHIPDGCALL